MLNTTISKNLKKVRHELKLTQEEVANKAKIHVNYYARIERGEVNPTLDVFERIVKALKVKSSDILPY